MLKTVSSITNALGAMNYKGTWNANTNTPTLASGAGVKGDYYVVSVSGTTSLDGISNWGVGDWVAFNGTTWQRLEGGADLNGVNLTVSGTSNLTGNVTYNNNLVQGTAAKGINFTANTPAAGMTSQLLNYYEEGTWTPTDQSGAGLTFSGASGSYTRVGNMVKAYFTLTYPSTASGVQNYISLPIASNGAGSLSVAYTNYGSAICGFIDGTFTRFVVADFSGNALTNANLSGKRLDGVVIYRTA